MYIEYSVFGWVVAVKARGTQVGFEPKFSIILQAKFRIMMYLLDAPNFYVSHQGLERASVR